MPIILELAVLLYLFSFLLLGAHAHPRVHIGGTTVTGRNLGEAGVHFFGGLPFAEPPVGDLRFRSPVLKTHLDGPVFNATEYGPACLQPPGPLAGTLGISEDCLTINIHRPAGVKYGEKLPVLLWTYGGAFTLGTSSIFNGSTLVSHSIQRGTPVVYVNFNYRLGPFGFPAGKEAEDRRELNLGVEDVMAALKWVHANIDAFGGDKDKITIFGQSSGAISIGLLYFNQEFEQLVRGAILESGSANSNSAFSASDREDRWQDFVGAIPSCSSIAASGNVFPCLQNASETEIATAYSAVLAEVVDTTQFFAPLLDGVEGVWPDIPSRLYEQGRFAKIPFMAGTNLDEGTFLAEFARQPGINEPILKAALVGLVSPPLDEAQLDNTADTLLDLYPDIPELGSPYNTGGELFDLPSTYKRVSSILGDVAFEAPRRQWMDVASRHGVKSYGYLFTQPQPLVEPDVGVEHGSEIAFVYGNPLDPSPSARRLSNMMMDYWISFTVNLHPNDSKGSRRPVWPRYTRSSKVLLQLHGENTTVIPDTYREEQISFAIDNSISTRR
ncbi:triacylglycerol lipase 3 [Coprinopsis marcescibilis]|uniref:Carboxylic ester hydrolase n=1 Tax=Coprinopsis marcescibilis TaxID=230819 RepID=A0A5C3KZN7_COPMA|nr:triacylglycerol lipase 3 [Coprinopsis marcescibilis]